MDERKIVEIVDAYFASIYNYVYFHLLNQGVTETIVSQIFKRMIAIGTDYRIKNERLLLFKLAREELCVQKSTGEALVAELSGANLSPDMNQIFIEFTWEERGFLYLVNQDMADGEIADILCISRSELRYRESSLAKKLEKLYQQSEQRVIQMEPVIVKETKRMDKILQFYEIIKNDMSVILATSADKSVTMRQVSPVYYNRNILIFTDPGSLKYQQLKANPNCCVAAGAYFAEARAEFLGATMLDSNEELRKVYCDKFPGAFDEGVELGGRDAEFILLRPNKLKGWAFENDTPSSDQTPTIPYEIII